MSGLMATPPASGGQPEESLAALPSDSGVQSEDASQVQQQTEGALSVSFCTKRKHSSVWDYFAKEKVHGIWKAQCILCMKYISGETKAGPGTAHLMEHLDNCICVSCDSGKKQLCLSSRSGKRRKVSVQSGVSDQQAARKALSSMFILQKYPHSIADHPELHTFIGALQPFYEMVNQKTIIEDILDLYKSGKNKILNNLRKNKSRVAVATEFWTDNKNRGYMAVIGHYKDESWKPRRSILRFLRVSCPRTPDVLCEALHKCLQSWDLDCNLSTLSLENYSTNDALIPLIKAKIGPDNLLLGGKMLHMGCCAHNLNSVVKDGLEVIWTKIKGIRDIVAYCLSTKKRYEMFKEAAKSQQVELTEELCLDCKTSWNSTYVMLHVALLHKKVFDHLKQIDNHFTSPTAEDWELASSACDRLKHFHKLSEMFSGTKFVTGNNFFLQICEIKFIMQRWLGFGYPVIEKMSVAMIEKFDKYWSDFHELMALATILDPRGKTANLHVCYSVLFGEENADAHVRKSVDFLRELVNEYKKVQTEEEVMRALSCSPTSSISVEEVSPIFKDFVACMKAQRAERMQNELDHYLKLGCYSYLDKKFDILGCYWNVVDGFPTLRMIARDIFAIPITTIAPESSLSTGGRVLSGHLSCLAPKTLEALICSQDWISNELQGEDERELLRA